MRPAPRHCAILGRQAPRGYARPCPRLDAQGAGLRPSIAARGLSIRTLSDVPIWEFPDQYARGGWGLTPIGNFATPEKVRCADAQGNALPFHGYTGEDPMQVSRRGKHRAENGRRAGADCGGATETLGGMASGRGHMRGHEKSPSVALGTGAHNLRAIIGRKKEFRHRARPTKILKRFGFKGMTRLWVARLMPPSFVARRHC